MKRLFILASMILLILMLYLPVHAGIPMDTVQNNVNKVLDVLRDPKLKGAAAKEAKKKKLRVIYDQTFDGVELGKRTLGRNWNSLTVPQRQEFVTLFRQVLEKAYMDRILAYTNEKIVYERESMISKNQAEVQTKVVTASKETPITYRVIFKDGSWKAYDVLIENVSLVMNYRTQFNDILAKNNPEQLLDILRKKVKAQ